ncbi:hypothetical protein [Neorhodopirellula pilleata]|uniref:Uncharacterized protein n=1 Tax=Neorhodopirellula pilleata TaxID=2714738 RepID=A0A5C6AHQ0_9BACT|nr:hypothetical protein [Neorhodopirellula pilleata]TWT98946.1 hypothetical protein Pla100_21120 [Neorhodopirellula pilleata]
MRSELNHRMWAASRMIAIVLGITLPLSLSGEIYAQFSQGSDTTRQSDSSASQKTIPNVVMREGTLIGPIRGRFVLRGQRWWFIVEESGQADQGQLAEMIDAGNARSIVETQSTILERSTKGTQSTTSTQSRYERKTVVDSSIGEAQSEQQVQRRVLLPPFESMIVVENLMLGRIASAIEEDPADDHWTITGRITEFQNDNRLMLTTAHRTVVPVSQ